MGCRTGAALLMKAALFLSNSCKCVSVEKSKKIVCIYFFEKCVCKSNLSVLFSRCFSVPGQIFETQT